MVNKLLRDSRLAIIGPDQKDRCGEVVPAPSAEYQPLHPKERIIFDGPRVRRLGFDRRCLETRTQARACRGMSRSSWTVAVAGRPRVACREPSEWQLAFALRARRS